MNGLTKRIIFNREEIFRLFFLVVCLFLFGRSTCFCLRVHSSLLGDLTIVSAIYTIIHWYIIITLLFFLLLFGPILFEPFTLQNFFQFWLFLYSVLSFSTVQTHRFHENLNFSQPINFFSFDIIEKNLFVSNRLNCTNSVSEKFYFFFFK